MMKKIKRRGFLSLLLAVLLVTSFIPFGVLGGENSSVSEESSTEPSDFDETYYRFNDFADVVSKDHYKELNQMVSDYKNALKMDFPVAIRKGLPEGFSTVQEYADAFYTRNGFGYGEHKDGVLLILDLESRKFGIYYYGGAKELFASRDEEFRNQFKEDAKDDSLTYYDLFLNYYNRAFEMTRIARYGEYGDSLLNGRGKAEWTRTDQPYWYPESIPDFKDFHGENLPRVVDDARIFTPEQKAELSQIAQRIVDKYGLSYVMFTDDDTFGRSKELYSADFLYFNGYGAGEDYSAVVFFLSLQTGNRGWRTTSTNSCENIFTADITYEIDELVDSYMRSGDYFTAFKLQAEYIEQLMEDLKDLPDWYPENMLESQVTRRTRTFEKPLDLSKPRFVDQGGFFSEEQIAEYTEKFKELGEKYGVDVVIFTDNDTHRFSQEDYCQDFYYYNDYSKDGILINIIPARLKGGYRICVQAFSEEPYLFNNMAEMDELLQKAMETEKGMAYFLKESYHYVEHLLRRWCMPLGAPLWGLFVAGGFLIAHFFLAKPLKKKLLEGMVIEDNVTMSDYEVKGSRRIGPVRTYFLYSQVSKTRHVYYSSGSSSSGGSSSSSSSYSSGTSSSGGSYSSGGRDF